MTDIDPSRPSLPPKVLLLASGGAVAVAALIVFGAILPAEFHKDPLGLGKLTGIDRLWAPAQVEIGGKAAAAGPSAREFATAFRTDVIEIPLGSGDGGGSPSELEYKVAMKKGAVLVYEWRVEGVTNPDEFYYDFHGHTVPKTPDEKMIVSTHKQAVGLSGKGALTAPFDGIQGWYLQNQAGGPAVVRIKLSGFYDLVPAGKPGNEFGIQANLPAAKVKEKMIEPQG
jgi:hypothetical protein